MTNPSQVGVGAATPTPTAPAPTAQQPLFPPPAVVARDWLTDTHRSGHEPCCVTCHMAREVMRLHEPAPALRVTVARSLSRWYDEGNDADRTNLLDHADRVLAALRGTSPAQPHGHADCPDGPDAHEDFCLNGRQE